MVLGIVYAGDGGKCVCELEVNCECVCDTLDARDLVGVCNCLPSKCTCMTTYFD